MSDNGFNLGDISMLDLFRQEVETHSVVLNEGLLALEQAPTDGDLQASCMRAAHSIKGAARIVGVGPAVELAHAMEDAFVAAQEGRMPGVTIRNLSPQCLRIRAASLAEATTPSSPDLSAIFARCFT